MDYCYDIDVDLSKLPKHFGAHLSFFQWRLLLCLLLIPD
jgi:hypothetical protein